MKFILFSLGENNKKSIIINEYGILNDSKIKEIVLSKSKLNSIINLKQKGKINILDKIKTNVFKAKLTRVINLKNDEDTRYILDEGLNITDRHVKELISMIEELGLKKIASLNEMDRNIFKYIDEYGIKNNINIQDIRMLFVYKDINNIDLNVIREAVKLYKKVNIYLKGNVNKKLLEDIDRINDSEGSVVEVIKYNKKAFIDYNVIYYVDDYKINYPRMRLNKKSLTIDLEDSKKDKFNSNIILFNKIENKTDITGYIVKRYGVLPMAYVLRQM